MRKILSLKNLIATLLSLVVVSSSIITQIPLFSGQTIIFDKNTGLIKIVEMSEENSKNGFKPQFLSYSIPSTAPTYSRYIPGWVDIQYKAPSQLYIMKNPPPLPPKKNTTNSTHTSVGETKINNITTNNIN